MEGTNARNALPFEHLAILCKTGELGLFTSHMSEILCKSKLTQLQQPGYKKAPYH
jgi:hypothetical protein